MTLNHIGAANRRWAQQAALAAIGLVVLATAVGLFILVRTRGQVAELDFSIKARKTRLAENRRTAGAAPKAAAPAALNRSRAVSRLRETLSSLSVSGRFTIDEFQASTDELPYLTTYATDNKDPGWTQVAVRATLTGRAPDLTASIGELQKLDVPFEVDTLELMRRSTDNSGRAVVTASLTMRVLVYRGES